MRLRDTEAQSAERGAAGQPAAGLPAGEGTTSIWSRTALMRHERCTWCHRSHSTARPLSEQKPSHLLNRNSSTRENVSTCRWHSCRRVWRPQSSPRTDSRGRIHPFGELHAEMSRRFVNLLSRELFFARWHRCQRVWRPSSSPRTATCGRRSTIYRHATKPCTRMSCQASPCGRCCRRRGTCCTVLVHRLVHRFSGGRTVCCQSGRCRQRSTRCKRVLRLASLIVHHCADRACCCC